MIDFQQTWLPNIVGYAELFAGEAVLRRAWLHGARCETSIYYPDEMLEQVFGDLDSEAMILEAPQQLVSRPELVRCLKTFLERLSAWEEWLASNVDQDAWGKGFAPLEQAEIVFTCEAWVVLRQSASKLVAEARGETNEPS